jgi:hypothetical protein
MADEGECGHLKCTGGQLVEVGQFGCCVRGLLQEGGGHGSCSGLGQEGVDRMLRLGGGGVGTEPEAVNLVSHPKDVATKGTGWMG